MQAPPLPTCSLLTTRETNLGPAILTRRRFTIAQVPPQPYDRVFRIPFKYKTPAKNDGR